MANTIICPYCGTMNEIGSKVCGTEDGAGCGGSLKDGWCFNLEARVLQSSTTQRPDDGSDALGDLDEEIKEIEKTLKKAWEGYVPVADIREGWLFALVIVLHWILTPYCILAVKFLALSSSVGVILALTPAVVATVLYGRGILNRYLTVTEFRAYQRSLID